tara:strand:+ start:7266 stop:8495 length:1230 start_codon:yes stop_codon:yes gene_type:complete
LGNKKVFILTLILSLAVILVAFYLAIKNPANFFLIILFDSLIINRFYNNFFGIPFSFILLVIAAFTYLFNNYSFKTNINSFFIHVFVISIYFFLSHSYYFENYDLNIMNNFLLMILLYSSINSNQIEKIWVKMCKLAVLIGGFLSLDIFLPFVSLANERQVGFFIILSIVFLLAGKKVSNSKLFSNYMLIILSFTVLVSLGRLNVAILLIILPTYYLIFNRLNAKTILSRSLLLAIFPMIILSFGNNIATFFQFTDFSYSSSFYDESFRIFTQGRNVIYDALISQFNDNPIFGLGFNSFTDLENTYNPTFNNRSRTQVISSHSIPLQYLAETGIVGFFLYYSLLIRTMLCGNQLIKNKNKFVKSYGTALFFISLAMIIGSSLDNHGFNYKHIFILISLLPYFLMLSKNK